MILSKPVPELDALGMRVAGERARSKLLESFPDGVREKIAQARTRYRFHTATGDGARADGDMPVVALANAIREARIVFLEARSQRRRRVLPVALVMSDNGWGLADAEAPNALIPASEWGDINISSRRFRG